MAGTRYVRRDRVIRLDCAEEDKSALVEFVDGERTVRHVVPHTTITRLTEPSQAAEAALALWSVPEIRDELAGWQRARLAATQGPLAGDEQLIERLCLRVDDDRLAALPLEQALLRVLPKAGPWYPPIPRLVPVPPRVAQVPFTLPLRLLQLEQRGDFDLPRTIKAVFGSHVGGRNLDAVMRVKRGRARRFSRWALPSGWKTVDVLHLDSLAVQSKPRLLALSSPGDVGTLGWLVRCVDVWRTRLVVIRGDGGFEMGSLRRFAHKLAARGGPAVWLLDGDGADVKDRLARFYDKLIHDAPLDLAVAIALAGSPPSDSNDDTLIVGCGREEQQSPGR